MRLASSPFRGLESLEPRALLSAPYAVPAGPLFISGNQLAIPLRIHSDTPIDLSTVNSGDISITGPNGYFDAEPDLETDPVVLSNGDVLAKYFLHPPSVPDNQYNWTSFNGTYRVSMSANAVRNTAGEGNVARQVGSYWLWFTPVVTLASAHPVTGTGVDNPYGYDGPRDDSLFIQFNYSVPSPIEHARVVYHVTGPNGYDQTGYASSDAPTPIPPEYTQPFTSKTFGAFAPAPGGTWDPTDNGVYTIQFGLPAGTATPTMALLLGTQTITVNNAAPRAEVIAQTTRAKDWLVTVHYIPGPGNTINLASVSDGDVGIAGYEQGTTNAGTLVQPPTLNQDGSATAIYSIPSILPNGWNFYQSGAFTIRSLPNQVTDNAGHTLGAGPIATFNLTFSLPTFLSQRTISATAAAWDIELNFNNVGGLLTDPLYFTAQNNNQGFSAQDIQIWTSTASGTVTGLPPVQVQFISASNSADNTLSLHYRILPQSGSLTDNTFRIRLVNSALYFAAFPGGGVDGVLAPQTLHFAGPTVLGIQTLSHTNTAWDIDLTFNNPGSLINLSSLSAQNLIATAPGNRSIRVTLTSYTNTNGVLHVRYRISPGGFLSSLPTGSYSFALRDASVGVIGQPALPGRFIGNLSI